MNKIAVSYIFVPYLLIMKKVFFFTMFILFVDALFAQNFSEATFVRRRELFAKEVRAGVAIIPSTRKDGRLNKNFYYLTGIDQPGFVYAFDMQERGENGRLFAPDQTSELEAFIEKTKVDKKRLILSVFASDFNQKYFDRTSFVNADSILVYKRAVKDEEEIAVLREACRITAKGIKQMYQNMKHGMSEKELLKIMDDHFKREGGDSIAFWQVASGNLATTPHAGTTDKVPAPDEMLVVDIGAMKDQYTADITVSFTISGKFTKEQETIYNIVYQSLETGVKGMIKGNFHAQVERAAMDVIVDELYNLGLITDRESPWQRAFWIQHGFGHHIGLDTHDVWYDYLRMVPDDRRVYIPGMVMTFEPAIYFPKDGLDARPRRLARLVSEEEFMNFAQQIRPIYEKYSGIAVRLEEDILIKDDGTNENLTKMSLKDQTDDAYVTYCEQTNFQKTPRYTETVEYCQRLAAVSPFAHYTAFGKSPQGRDLPLLIVDRDGCFTPETQRKTGKVVMMVIACTHSGEPDGKDAGLIFLRDLLVHQKHQKILDHVTILFVPIFNVDGHENFSSMNRINQNGPEESGARLTAQNINLNRDYLKAVSPEMQHWLDLYHQWLPEFFMDIHVTDGADFQYVSTYGLDVKSKNMEANIRKWAIDVFEKQFKEQMNAASYPVFPYFEPFSWNNVESGVVISPFPPQYSNGYAAAMNRVGILIENHIYKPYEQRVKATYELLRVCGQILNREHASLKKSIALSDQIVASSAFRTAPLDLNYRTSRTDSVMVDFLTWGKKTTRSDLSGADWTVFDYENPVTIRTGLYTVPEVLQSVQLPDAYIIKPECTHAIALLDRHHITYSRLKEGTTMLVETRRFTTAHFSQRQYEGHVTVTPEYTTQTERVFFPAGSVLIPMNQIRARLVAHLLEPNAPSSLVYWGYFNTYCQPASEFYVNLGYMEVTGREMLAQNPELRKTFEAKKATDPDFANDSQAILRFFMNELRKNVEPDINLYPVGRIIYR